MRLKFVCGRAQHGTTSVRKGGQPPPPLVFASGRGCTPVRNGGGQRKRKKKGKKEKEREEKKRKDELDGCVRARDGRRHVRWGGKGRVGRGGGKGGGEGL